MSVSKVYLDHNASTVLLDAARGAMHEVMDMTGNPSSVHAYGRDLASKIDNGRKQVADLAGATRGQVVFTGSATEAITQAIVGGVRHFGFDRVLVSAGEHAAVDKAAEICGCEVNVIGLHEDGTIDVDAIKQILAQCDERQETALVCVHMVNGETGIIQPIDEIAVLVGPSPHMLFVDAVQAFGKLDIGFGASAIDMMAISAHKMGGPTGIGALLVKEHCNQVRLIPGGGQEQGRRGGTQSAMLIAGFGAAAGAVGRNFDLARLGALIDRFETAICGLGDDIVVFGQKAKRIGSVSYFAMAGIGNETALIGLDLKGIAVSAGSACSSGKTNLSPVLKAMHISDKIAASALRVSVGWNSTQENIDRAIVEISQIHARQAQQNHQHA